MADFDFQKYRFERTVWANMELAKMCPGNNIAKFEEMMKGDDTVEKLNQMMDIIMIMNKAYERKAKREDPNHEENLITRDMLLDLDEDTLGKVSLAALGQMKADGEVTVEAEPKKNEET